MLAIGGNAASTGYNLTRSLRIRSSATAYLNRTPASAGNRRIFTWSAWVKTSRFKGQIFTAGKFTDPAGDNYGLIMLNNSTSQLQLNIVVGGGGSIIAQTPAVFRDPSSWYHFVVAVDTTQATNSNGVKMYVNGVQQTLTFPVYTQNQLTEFNNTTTHNLGQLSTLNDEYFDGYLAEVNFIDGQQLAASSFGSTNTRTGVWQPARYTGTYGTNGFYLPFTDNSALTTSSNVGLGKDFSGNGNYFATNNISITAGTTYDSMTDVPTLTSATAANFCIANPLDCNANTTLSNGNLTASNTASLHRNVRCTIGYPTTGKFYHEVIVLGGASQMGVGIAASNQPLNSQTGGNGIIYTEAGNFEKDGSVVATGKATFTTNDIIGVAFDCGSNSVTFYKNNVSQGSVTPTTGYQYFPYLMIYNAAPAINFGQRPFSYTPPTGFVALNTFNLPTSTIVKGNTVMDVALNTPSGAGSVTGIAFQPDVVWLKSRNIVENHNVYDSVRGATKVLAPNSTGAEATISTGITSFNANGFSFGSGAYSSGQPYVNWLWNAGSGSTSSNTNGTITSTVSVNASAGFSVVTYTGAGAARTVGHGLGVAPSFYIVKSRNPATPSVDGYWIVYTAALGAGSALLLNSTNAINTSGGWWNNTAPTSSVFSVGTDTNTNASGTNFVAYCWTPIAGYSSFGSYAGNGSATGPFVYTGFQPRYLMVKRSDSTANWFIWDTARNPYNVAPAGVLFAESSAAEYATSNGYSFGITSNGFYLPVSTAGINGSGGTFIYAAFATSPFKNSLAF